ncbi:MAG: hypothetical protein KGL43_14470 [Burkholderiales bacterium]|nr:hypothetical protein [Burkholderiales bacterium]
MKAAAVSHSRPACAGWWPAVPLQQARRGGSPWTLPFDGAREQYACAVRAGLLPNSMLASRDVERTLDALERLTLGPLARRV